MHKTLTAIPLTKREEEIMHLLAKCYTYKDMCQELGGISIKTLNCHIDHIMAKTSLRKKELLISYAQKNGYGEEALV